MNRDDDKAYSREVTQRLASLFRDCYGLRAKGLATSRGPELGRVEAGMAVIGAYWQLDAILADAGTSYHHLNKQVRMDVLLAELLTDPTEPATPEWAELYGYVSLDSLARAFRQRYGVGVADARRVGMVGLWLASAVRRPRSDAGVLREQQARDRIAAFRRAVRSPGPDSRRALHALGRHRAEARATRPRYPAVGVSERHRLGGVGA